MRGQRTSNPTVGGSNPSGRAPSDLGFLGDLEDVRWLFCDDLQLLVAPQRAWTNRLWFFDHGFTCAGRGR
jgi:hypothetical protein